MHRPRHGLALTAAGCATGLTVLVVVLFLLPSATPPPPVTIASIDWQIRQSTFDNGTPEFIPRWINQSGPFWGFPFHLPAGGSFNDSLVFTNDEPVARPICTASVNPPLYLVSTSPTLPMLAAPQEDSQLTLELSVHAGPGTSFSGLGVLNALGC